jgi:hypothetical protein
MAKDGRRKITNFPSHFSSPIFRHHMASFFWPGIVPPFFPSRILADAYRGAEPDGSPGDREDIRGPMTR